LCSGADTVPQDRSQEPLETAPPASPEIAPVVVAETALPASPETAPPGFLAPVVPDVPKTPHRKVSKRSSRSGSRRSGPRAPEDVFAAELEAGKLPSIRQIKSRMSVGHPKATDIQKQLAAVVGS